MKGSVGALYWHVHHDKLVEILTEPVAERRAYIKRTKPARERALRLRLIKRVRGKLPVGLVKALAAYDKAGAAYDKAWAAYDKARAAYDKAGTAKAGAAYVKALAAYNKARAAYDKAGAAYNKAWAAYDKVRAAYNKVLQDNMPAILALHEKECPNCPWGGKTIFPRVQI